MGYATFPFGNRGSYLPRCLLNLYSLSRGVLDCSLHSRIVQTQGDVLRVDNSLWVLWSLGIRKNELWI